MDATQTSVIIHIKQQCFQSTSGRALHIGGHFVYGDAKAAVSPFCAELVHLFIPVPAEHVESGQKCNLTATSR